MSTTTLCSCHTFDATRGGAANAVNTFTSGSVPGGTCAAPGSRRRAPRRAHARHGRPRDAPCGTQAAPNLQVIMLSGTQVPARSSTPCASAPSTTSSNRDGGVRSGGPRRRHSQRDGEGPSRARSRGCGRRRAEDPDGTQPCWSARHAPRRDHDRTGRGQRRERLLIRARAASARRSSRASSTADRPGGNATSSRSTARRCRPTYSKASCSDTKRVRSPAPRTSASASSSSRTAAR